MRKFSAGLVLASALLSYATAAPAAAQTDFSGKWVLDKSKSSKLPMSWVVLKSVTMDVKQDEQEIVIESKSERPREAPVPTVPGVGGGPARVAGGGGPSRHEGGGFPPSTTYGLDGTETTVPLMNGIPASMYLKAEWQDGGRTLHLGRITEYKVNGEVFNTITTEDWSLSAGGKTLTIERFRQWSVNRERFTLVFKRRK
jgi:hypothetical protein